MPAFEFDRDRQAWVKQCSYCKEDFVGTRDQAESEKIFEKDFAFGSATVLEADGFRSRCRFCESSKRRELGITRAILRSMFENQNGKCGICTKDISTEYKADSSIHAHVDHDENTMVVRGLLCGDCNRGIGLLKHDTVILQAAITYLLNSMKKEAA